MIKRKAAQRLAQRKRTAVQRTRERREHQTWSPPSQRDAEARRLTGIACGINFSMRAILREWRAFHRQKAMRETGGAGAP